MTRYDFMGPHEIITRHTRPRTRGRRTAPLTCLSIPDIISMQLQGGALYRTSVNTQVKVEHAEQLSSRNYKILVKKLVVTLIGSF